MGGLAGAIPCSIRPISDPFTPGLREWRINTTAGNCKDYALTKRQQLLAMGFPSSAALMAIARLPSGTPGAMHMGHRGGSIRTPSDEALRDPPDLCDSSPRSAHVAPPRVCGTTFPT